MSNEEPLIFLCYSKEDKKRTEELYLQLKEAGLNPWMDKPPKPYHMDGIGPGKRWEDTIKETITKSAYFFVLLSKKSVAKRGYFHREYAMALEEMNEMPQEETFVIPVLLEECDIPSVKVGRMSLRDIQWYELYSDKEGVESLINYIKNRDDKAADSGINVREENDNREEVYHTKEIEPEAKEKLILISEQERKRKEIKKLQFGIGLKILDRVAINVRSHKFLKMFIAENPKLTEIMQLSRNETEALIGVRNWVLKELKSNPAALNYYRKLHPDRKLFEALRWRDYAAIRILDYIDSAGKEYVDYNQRGEVAISNPLKAIWLAINYGTCGATPPFFEDMLHLFRQFRGEYEPPPPSREKLEDWMSRYSSGRDPRIVRLHEENRDRIISVIIDRIEKGEIKASKFKFYPEMSYEQKFLKVLEWWEDYAFQLKFAARTSDEFDEMLGFSLSPETMKVLYNAQGAGIPFFITPYYLSLLSVRIPYFTIGADMAIQDYIIYNEQLVSEFGHIIKWDRSDEVSPGSTNNVGWLLPTPRNIRRTYPDSATLIPDSMNRTCGGICSICNRMAAFQAGKMNVELEKQKNEKNWPKLLSTIMDYFENDSRIRDILISGGDALMTADTALKEILDTIYKMALRKKEANRKRKDGEKYAEIVRIRLASRVPVHLPQRITPALAALLKKFREKALKIGIKQFIIQTHFVSPMEVTCEVSQSVQRLLKAGWLVTNEAVFTTAASRRGHTAKLRQLLNHIGVLSYHTFSMEGYAENGYNYTPFARAVQEQLEEKVFGNVPDKHQDKLKQFHLMPEAAIENIRMLTEGENLPFLATDRHTYNMPNGIGDSFTFRVIGITRHGRRILEFDFDPEQEQSPAINRMDKVIIVESKSVSEYLQQLTEMGEDVSEYEKLYGYSIGQSEPQSALYRYSEYDYQPTEEITNFMMGGA